MPMRHVTSRATENRKYKDSPSLRTPTEDNLEDDKKFVLKSDDTTLEGQSASRQKDRAA